MERIKHGNITHTIWLSIDGFVGKVWVGVLKIRWAEPNVNSWHRYIKYSTFFNGTFCLCVRMVCFVSTEKMKQFRWNLLAMRRINSVLHSERVKRENSMYFDRPTKWFISFSGVTQALVPKKPQPSVSRVFFEPSKSNHPVQYTICFFQYNPKIVLCNFQLCHHHTLLYISQLYLRSYVFYVSLYCQQQLLRLIEFFRLAAHILHSNSRFMKQYKKFGPNRNGVNLNALFQISVEFSGWFSISSNGISAALIRTASNKSRSRSFSVLSI